MNHPFANPAHAITASTADPHMARIRWMAEHDIASISTCPSGQTVISYASGYQVFGMAADLLPAHLRPK
jgi:hypothetical protein